MSDQRVGIAALERAVKILGSQQAAADVCRVRQTAISECLKRGKRVPAEWCIPLECATRNASNEIPRGDFRPDLWPADEKLLLQAVQA